MAISEDLQKLISVLARLIDDWVGPTAYRRQININKYIKVLHKKTNGLI